jgi:hypothetical protein
MKLFQCGPEKEHNQINVWFAWYPVFLENTRKVVWLEKVKRVYINNGRELGYLYYGF